MARVYACMVIPAALDEGPVASSMLEQCEPSGYADNTTHTCRVACWVAMTNDHIGQGTPLSDVDYCLSSSERLVSQTEQM